MFKNILKLAVSILFLIALDFKAYAYDDGDFQIWHTEAQEFNVTKGWKIPIEEEFRYGKDATELYYHHYDAGVAYSVSKNLDISAHYRQIYEGENGKFKPEYRPYIQATPKIDIWVFRLDDRNRLEYRIFDYKDDILQYRNKLTVKLPLKAGKFEFAPYVADEVFADVGKVIIRRNRLSAGAALSFAKNLKTEAYYMLQSTKKSGKWIDSHILGLKLKVIF